MVKVIGNYSHLISIILMTKKITMNSKEEKLYSDNNIENNKGLQEEQINLENTNIKNESSEDNNKTNQNFTETENNYTFGWSSYSETTNGRFAMLGFLAIILIELFSQQSFLKWAGIL